MEYEDKGPSLCKFSRYLVVIKIMDIRHKICHICYKNADFRSIFLQKDSLYCCYKCAKFSSTCKIIYIFSCISFSVLRDNFLWMTLYHFSCHLLHRITHRKPWLSSRARCIRKRNRFLMDGIESRDDDERSP